MWIKTIDNCLIRLEDVSYIHTVKKAFEDNIEICIIADMKNECMDKILFASKKPTLKEADLCANLVLDTILYGIENDVAFVDLKEV